MNRRDLSLVLLVGLAACKGSPATDVLENPNDPNATASGEASNTFNHDRESTGAQNGITDVPTRQADESLAGTPIEVARMHGAQKISVASLGATLADLGVTLTVPSGGGGGVGGKGGGMPGPGDDGSGDTSGSTATTAELYTDGKSALGAPVFASRAPEMIVPSTSSLAKEFDIFVAAAPDIMANIGSSTRCPGVVLVEAGQLTADGISCLIGKPASAAHLTLANKLVSDLGDSQKGLPIAVATLLAAAHISE